MLKVETLRGAHGFDGLKARWTWLQQQCDTTIFQSYELNRIAARWFADRESPNIIVAESGSGMAIIPAVRREREFALIGETLFDYRDVLSAGDPMVLQHAWRELGRAGLPLQVTALRGEAVRERWQSLHPTPFCNAPSTRLADTTAQQFVKEHHKSAKASRKLGRQGLRLIRRDSRLRRVAQWIYRHKAEWQGQSHNLFLDRRRQNLMLYIVRHGVLNCSVWSYEDTQGAVAAALVTFRHKNIRHFYTIHHDPQWEWYSPGQCLIFEVTRESLMEGLDVDFMTGEYPYKNRLATAMIPLYRLAASAEELTRWTTASPRVVAPAA